MTNHPTRTTNPNDQLQHDTIIPLPLPIRLQLPITYIGLGLFAVGGGWVGWGVGAWARELGAVRGRSRPVNIGRRHLRHE